MGIVTTSTEIAFTQSAETIYDFVTNPANWTKTYPGSERIGELPEVPTARRACWTGRSGGAAIPAANSPTR